MAICSCIQTIFSFTHIQGLTLGAGEKVEKVVGGVNGMGMDRIDEVGDRGGEGQAAGVYGAVFTAGPLVRVGARDGTGGLGPFNSNKEVGRMTGSD